MKEPKEMGFNFQEIALTEATALARSGSSRYAALAFELSQRLPALERENLGKSQEERKGFAFGLPNGDSLDEKVIKSLPGSVSKSLKFMGVEWQVRWSAHKKLFVCVPMNQDVVRRAQAVPKGPVEPKSNGNGTRKYKTVSEESKRLFYQARDLKAQGLTGKEIAKRLGMDESKVSYYLAPSGLASKLAKSEISAVPKIGPKRNSERNARVLDLARDGHNAREIAESVGLSRSGVDRIIQIAKRKGVLK